MLEINSPVWNKEAGSEYRLWPNRFILIGSYFVMRLLINTPAKDRCLKAGAVIFIIMDFCFHQILMNNLFL